MCGLYFHIQMFDWWENIEIFQFYFDRACGIENKNEEFQKECSYIKNKTRKILDWDEIPAGIKGMILKWCDFFCVMDGPLWFLMTNIKQSYNKIKNSIFKKSFVYFIFKRSI